MTSRSPVVWIDGIGLRGPGLCGWAASVDVLAGRAPHVAAATVLVPPPALPPAERRRVGKGVKVALEAGFEAAANAGRDAATMASVFTSSSGDGDNCDAICRALADDRLISPTRFHNSVHNAPSGYWGIASGSMAPSTSLCAYDDSFVAGLDDALGLLADGTSHVLLVAYDAPYPEPLHAARPTPDSFAVALVLAREWSTASLAGISFEDRSAGEQTTMRSASLEHLRASIPAARALPILAAIARGEASDANHRIAIDDARGRAVGLHLRTLSRAIAASTSKREQCA